jgi:hypothetical protein
MQFWLDDLKNVENSVPVSLNSFVTFKAALSLQTEDADSTVVTFSSDSTKTLKYLRRCRHHCPWTATLQFLSPWSVFYSWQDGLKLCPCKQRGTWSGKSSTCSWKKELATPFLSYNSVQIPHTIQYHSHVWILISLTEVNVHRQHILLICLYNPCLLL